MTTAWVGFDVSLCMVICHGLLKLVVLLIIAIDKPRGASPGRDYEDGISTKNLVLNILWCRIVGNYIEKGVNAPRATD